MHGRIAAVLVMNAGAPAVEVINHTEDWLLIAWYDTRGDHDIILGLDCDPTMTVDGDPRQRGHGLTLAAGHYGQNPGGRQFTDLLRVEQYAFAHTQAPHLHCDFGIAKHAPAHKAEPAAVLLSEVGDDS